MSFFKNIFKQKEAPITSYETFWDWFRQHENTFYKVVKEQGNIEKVFFDKLSVKLKELKDGYFYLTGMLNDETVELVFTADGAIENIVFVEELVSSAPKIDNWVFTALKPALSIDNVSIKMNNYMFTKNNINFYAEENENFPDEININIVHDDLDEANREAIVHGSYIFLDNFLGELNFATTIDNISFVDKNKASADLIPIEKLKDFLIWRQKEFVEKYDSSNRNTQEDNYSLLEGTLVNGNKLLAAINTGLLKWDSKASHPWIATIEIKYNGLSTNGMPDNKTSVLLNGIEDEILNDLEDIKGYLNIGRQTSEGVREIHFACKDFRLPSKTFHKIKQKYSSQSPISYRIYKDKYWRSFNQFIN
ncbi:DUF695 domain-containing protein [Mucilaginibacter phyllosphaerae]|uniref:DUF695 domain-containing protein n=1 Tax=Mucilaginibacter phyllosphaerae TaxID=1812349 RepID=A0A4Y8AKK2_9SPHI|nr:DUF695 domain-containing protein [Mucilaginibacter phyllosphaerae]